MSDFDSPWKEALERFLPAFLAFFFPEIARVNLYGKVVWSASGMDIVSEGFRVIGDYIEAIDFHHQVNRIEIATGRCELIHGRT